MSINDKKLKTLHCLKNNSIILVIFTITVLASVFTSLYKNFIFNKLQESNLTVSPIRSFSKQRIKFISAHCFSGKKTAFEEYVETITKENLGIITEVSQVGKSKILNKFTCTKYSIKGFFWHDLYVFRFIDSIQNFHPGFLKLLDIEIDKLQKVTENKPFMKMELICEIFQKL